MQMARRILPVLLLFFTQGTAFGQQAINWEGTIDSAKATASRSNRLVLVLFTADWCPSCHRLENDLRGQPGAAAALQANFVPVKVNYDYFQNTARQYGVDRLPTTVILAPTAAGEVLAVIPEAMPVDQYLSKLNGVAADARHRAAGAYAQIPPGPAAGSPVTVNPLRAGTGTMSPAGTLRPTDPPQDVPAAAPRMPITAVAVNVPSSAVAPAPVAPPTSPAPAAPLVALATPPSAPAASVTPPAAPAAPPSAPIAPPRQLPPVATAPNPTIGLDGYCPVQLVEKDRWQKGNRAWGVIHRGKVYLFAGPEEQHRFQADPDRYAPVNSGNDVVLALEVGHAVPGFREHGAKFDGHIYLFASEDTLKKFESNPPFYAERALQAIHPMSQTAALR
jgi:YHS domain-containing protein/thiol-disulfide isomerase/thioredoxin